MLIKAKCQIIVYELLDCALTIYIKFIHPGGAPEARDPAVEGAEVNSRCCSRDLRQVRAGGKMVA